MMDDTLRKLYGCRGSNVVVELECAVIGSGLWCGEKGRWSGNDMASVTR